jgi:hypothetical protein
MHLMPGTGISAELDSRDDVQRAKPGLFLDIPDGCYWLIETRHASRFGDTMGLYLYRADNGQQLRASVTRSNIDGS